MHLITSIDDPRVAAYRNLRDRTLRGESLFVTEGRVLTLRLLESEFQTESVLASEEYAPEFASLLGDRIPLYVAPESLLLEVVGFHFHRGVLGSGRRRPAKTLEGLMASVDRGGCLSLVVLPEVTKPENLGLVFRTAACFGVDGVVLGPRCCDPLARRALRVSMGGTLRVPFARSTDLLVDLEQLRHRFDVQLLATVLDDGAERIGQVAWPDRAGLLFGNETDGLCVQYLDHCDHRVTIPMQPGTDSLNLGVAAGVFVYERMRRRTACPSAPA